jgi:2-hydroxy-3-keto-5-methylthiopentenyl-1-phosphate phosphatase
MKTLIQCDFDGTVTEKDVSFLLLDAFARGDWRQLLTEYREQKISVGDFNTRAFAQISASKRELLEYMNGRVKIRAGFRELVAYCKRESFKFVIVSNGMDFYIGSLLAGLGLNDIEVFSGQATFQPWGIEARYIGPDGNQLDTDFKGAYTRTFLAGGYRVIYVGDGISDMPPARLTHHIFARGDLLTQCREAKLKCVPFDDLTDVVRGLEPFANH